MAVLRASMFRHLANANALREVEPAWQSTPEDLPDCRSPHSPSSRPRRDDTFFHIPRQFLGFRKIEDEIRRAWTALNFDKKRET